MSKTNFEEFLSSTRFADLTDRFQTVDFKTPVVKENLVEGQSYLMVYVIYCWDDIVRSDHDCYLDFGHQIVVYGGVNNENHKFTKLTDDGFEVANCFHPVGGFEPVDGSGYKIYGKFMDIENEHTGNFFYRILPSDYAIK